MSLVHAALTLQEEVEGTEHPPAHRTTMRASNWKPCPWEWITSHHHGPAVGDLKFPPEDLAEDLIGLCFNKVMIIHPVLHRPTFERQRKAQLHKHDLHFGRIYLLVCAVGSRLSSDERVTLKAPRGQEGAGNPLWSSAGWLYFSQAVSISSTYDRLNEETMAERQFVGPLLASAGLSDLQEAVLSALYLQGTSAPHAAWCVLPRVLSCVNR